MNIVIKNIRSGQIYLSVRPIILFTIIGISAAVGFLIGRM